MLLFSLSSWLSAKVFFNVYNLNIISKRINGRYKMFLHSEDFTYLGGSRKKNSWLSCDCLCSEVTAVV